MISEATARRPAIKRQWPGGMVAIGHSRSKLVWVAGFEPATP
jgi:hypothetical protein